MITLKINNKDVKVPKITELSTDKFCKLHDMNDFTIIDYLSVVLDEDYKIAENFKIKNPAFLGGQLFGSIPDYESKKPKKFIVVEGRKYDLNPDFTLGQRFQIEENGKGKAGMELILFILAVNADQGNHPALLEKIKQEPAALILPEAFFLLRNLSSGRSSGLRFLKIFRRLIKTKS